MAYQDSLPLVLLTPKGNSKFQILLTKVLSLKQKLSQILPQKKSNSGASTASCYFRL